MPFKKGDTVTFSVVDDLFNQIITANGILRHKVFGKLWSIGVRKSRWFNGNDVLVHESTLNNAI